MKSKKILVWLLVGVGVSCALVLWRLPVQATQSSQLREVESQVYLPLVQQSTLLPRSLYYIDDAQIYRMDRNGITIKQITFEVEAVSEFDVSPLDGTIAYVAGNQLVLADANGGNRQVIVVSDTNTRFYPHWSPDGQTLAYGNDDNVYFHAVEIGVSTLILDEHIYIPRDFSPNGSYLIVSIPGQPSGNFGVYDIASETLSLFEPLEPPDFLPRYWSSSTWSADSTHIYISEFVAAGPNRLGLWRYTPAGKGVLLLHHSTSQSRVAAPWQEPSGNLMYLFSPPEAGIEPDAPFYLVQTAADGVSNRVVLRLEAFRASHLSLWTPDGSGLVLVQNNGENMILIPVDASMPVVTLLNDASELGWSLHWGP